MNNNDAQFAEKLFKKYCKKDLLLSSQQDAFIQSMFRKGKSLAPIMQHFGKILRKVAADETVSRNKREGRYAGRIAGTNFRAGGKSYRSLHDCAKINKLYSRLLMRRFLKRGIRMKVTSYHFVCDANPAGTVRREICATIDDMFYTIFEKGEKRVVYKSRTPSSPAGRIFSKKKVEEILQAVDEYVTENTLPTCEAEDRTLQALNQGVST